MVVSGAKLARLPQRQQGAWTGPAPGPAAKGPVDAFMDNAATPQAWRARLVQWAKSHGAQSAIVTAASGASRVRMNITSPAQIAAIKTRLDRGCGVLEVTQSAAGRHTSIIFGRRCLDLVELRGSWRLRRQGDLRPTDKRFYSAMIALSASEAARLEALIGAADLAQGEVKDAGLNWETGHVGSVFGPGPFNCTSAWAHARIGDSGETLSALIGVEATGDPHCFHRRLEAESNERVFCTCTYGEGARSVTEPGRQFVFDREPPPTLGSRLGTLWRRLGRFFGGPADNAGSATL